MVFGVIVAVVLIALDQLAKKVAVSVLMPQGVLPAIPGVLEWRYIENDGAAFSLFAGRQSFLILFTSVALLIVAYILIFRRPKDKLEAFSFLLIFSGGVGNLIDRIAQGYVVDYINLLFVNFAVFNLADIYVTVGFALLLFAMIRGEIRERKMRANEVKQDEEDSTSNAAEEEPSEAIDDGGN